jgi:hypothetical protein
MCILGACVGCVGLHGLVMSVAASPVVRSCRRWHICKVWCLCGGCMEVGGMVHICMCDRRQGVCTVTVHLVEFGCGSPMRVSGRAPVDGYMLSMTQHFKIVICLCILQAARAHGCLWCVWRCLAQPTAAYCRASEVAECARSEFCQREVCVAMVLS